MRLVFKLLLIILVLFYSFVVAAQEDKHLKGKAIDISYYIYQGSNNTITIILDGYKLKSDEKGMIINHLEKFNFKFLNDSTVYIKTKLVYYIDGTIYRGRERQDKLKDDMIIVEVLSRKEAKNKLGITARYGLIHMEAK